MRSVDVAALTNRSPKSFGIFREGLPTDPIAATMKMPILLGLFAFLVPHQPLHFWECKPQGRAANSGTGGQGWNTAKLVAKKAPVPEKAFASEAPYTGVSKGIVV